MTELEEFEEFLITNPRLRGFMVMIGYDGFLRAMNEVVDEYADRIPTTDQRRVKNDLKMHFRDLHAVKLHG